jgi:5-(carboxyamino)imidazole ribonucleotide synthase
MPHVKIHLYGKAEPRPGRKMGHLVAFGNSAEEAMHRALEARAALHNAAAPAAKRRSPVKSAH